MNLDELKTEFIAQGYKGTTKEHQDWLVNLVLVIQELNNRIENLENDVRDGHNSST